MPSNMSAIRRLKKGHLIDNDLLYHAPIPAIAATNDLKSGTVVANAMADSASRLWSTEASLFSVVGGVFCAPPRKRNMGSAAFPLPIPVLDKNGCAVVYGDADGIATRNKAQATDKPYLEIIVKAFFFLLLLGYCWMASMAWLTGPLQNSG